MPLSENRRYRYPSAKSGPDLAAHLAALAEDVDLDTAGHAARLDKAEEVLPIITATDDIIFQVRDAAGNSTWLGASAKDGGPTPWAMAHLSRLLGLASTEISSEYMLALKDGAGLLTDLAIRASDGQFPDYVVDRLRERILNGSTPPSTTPPPAQGRVYADTVYTPGAGVLPVKTDSTRAAGWGSSSMQGMDARMEGMFSSRGVSYIKGGKGSERAEQIAARMGAVPALVTVAGGVVPAEGAVAVNVPNLPLTSALKTYSGTLAGIQGSLSYQSSPASYIFTRAAAGRSTTVAPGTPFTPDNASCRDAVNILWLGKNNMGQSGADALVIGLTDACFDWLAPLEKRALVLGHFINQTTPDSALERDQIMATNAAHKARYGRLFVDVQGYLASPQVWTDTKITPTAVDLDLQARGNLPLSLSSDAQHLNTAGYEAIKNLVSARLTELKWY